MIGKSLVELDLGAKYNVNVLAIYRDETIIVPPFSNDLLKKGDVLVVTGDRKYLTKFLNLKQN